MIFQNRQVRRLARGLNQSPRDFTTGRILGMQNPPMRVTTLATQKVMVILTIKGHPVIHQIPDRLLALANNRTHHALTAQPRTGLQGVGHMHFHRIPRIPLLLGQNRGNPTLRPRGVGFENIALRQHHHRPVTRRSQRKRKAGNPRADDHEIRIHRRHHEPDRPSNQTKFDTHAT